MIDSYDALVAAAGRFLKNSAVTSDIPTLVSLAESSLRRRLKLMDSRVTDTLTIADEVAELPADFGGLVDLRIDGHPWPIEAVSIQHLNAKPTCGGLTELYAVTADDIRFWPSAPETVEIIYKQELPALSDSVSSNWLLEKAPDAYLYATLVEAEPFLMNDERLPVWKRKLEEVITEVRSDDSEREWGSAPLVCRRVE